VFQWLIQKKRCCGGSLLEGGAAAAGWNKGGGKWLPTESWVGRRSGAILLMCLLQTGLPSQWLSVQAQLPAYIYWLVWTSLGHWWPRRVDGWLGGGEHALLRWEHFHTLWYTAMKKYRNVSSCLQLSSITAGCVTRSHMRTAAHDHSPLLDLATSMAVCVARSCSPLPPPFKKPP